MGRSIFGNPVRRTAVLVANEFASARYAHKVTRRSKWLKYGAHFDGGNLSSLVEAKVLQL